MRLLHVVAVQVRITAGPDKIAHFEVALLRHHMHQQRVAGDIERQAEEYIARALIELAGELAVGDVELEERVARGQRHFVQLADVPCRDDNPARIRVVLQLFHHRADLVDMTAVRRGPGTPLLAVDRPQIAVFIRPLVPDSDVVFVQIRHVGVTLQEPQQFMDDGA